jgi:hypothetical protein
VNAANNGLPLKPEYRESVKNYESCKCPDFNYDIDPEEPYKKFMFSTYIVF